MNYRESLNLLSERKDEIKSSLKFMKAPVHPVTPHYLYGQRMNAEQGYRINPHATSRNGSLRYRYPANEGVPMNRMMDQMMDPMMDQMMDPMVDPMVDQMMGPMIDQMTEPMMDQMMDQMMNPMMDPVMDQMIEQRIQHPVMNYFPQMHPKHFMSGRMSGLPHRLERGFGMRRQSSSPMSFPPPNRRNMRYTGTMEAGYTDVDVESVSSEPSNVDASSLGNDRLAPTKRKERAPSTTSFPTKLYKILSDPANQESVAWAPHGRAWRILKPKKFEEEVIPKYFRSARYASFMRQVNGWGFKRVTEGPDVNAYYHEMFLRGLPTVCSRMRRPQKGHLNAFKEVGQCPDFYKINALTPLPSIEIPPNPDECDSKVERTRQDTGSDERDFSNERDPKGKVEEMNSTSVSNLYSTKILTPENMESEKKYDFDDIKSISSFDNWTNHQDGWCVSSNNSTTSDVDFSDVTRHVNQTLRHLSSHNTTDNASICPDDSSVCSAIGDFNLQSPHPFRQTTSEQDKEHASERKKLSTADLWYLTQQNRILLMDDSSVNYDA